MAEAKRAGFGGGIVVDYPESKKARKYYLCLVAGSTSSSTFSTPQGLKGKRSNHRKETIWIRHKESKEGVYFTEEGIVSETRERKECHTIRNIVVVKDELNSNSSLCFIYATMYLKIINRSYFSSPFIPIFAS